MKESMDNIMNRMIYKQGPSTHPHIHTHTHTHTPPNTHTPPHTHTPVKGGGMTSVSSHAEVYSIIMTRIQILSEKCDRGFLIAVLNIISVEIIKTVMLKARTQKQGVFKMSHFLLGVVGNRRCTSEVC